MNNRPPFLLQIFGLFLIAVGVLLTLALIGFIVIGLTWPGSDELNYESLLLSVALLIPGLCTIASGKGFFDGSRLAWALVLPAGGVFVWLVVGSLISIVRVTTGGRGEDAVLIALVGTVIYLPATYVLWRNRHHLR